MNHPHPKMRGGAPSAGVVLICDSTERQGLLPETLQRKAANMDTVTVIFMSVADGERAGRQLQSMFSRDNIVLLTPETAKLGALTKSAPADQTGSRHGTEGLPEDQLFIYEDAFRHGCSVLVISAGDESTASAVRKLLEQDGAVSIEAARERWWNGVRGAEHEHYSPGGEKFNKDEKFYRLGFEAALHAKYRCREYDQTLSEMQADLEEVQQRYAGVDVEGPFVRGFERGRDYYQELCKQAPQ